MTTTSPAFYSLARLAAASCIVLACAVAAIAVPPNSSRPKIDDLGFLGTGVNSQAFGISSDGRYVVGWSAFDHTARREAFFWSETDGMIGLGNLPADDLGSEAAAVSNNGVVVGFSSVTGGAEAFRWTRTDGMVSIGTLGGSEIQAFARDVSADGSIIVGQSKNSANRQVAFVWQQGTGIVELGAGVLLPDVASDARGISSDGSTIVGFGGLRPPTFATRGWRWTEDAGFEDLGLAPGSGLTLARSASSDGSVVVGRVSFNGVSAFRWTETGGLGILGDLPGGGDFGEAYAASADGSVVVGYSSSDAGDIAFIWDQAHGMRDLKQALISDYGLELTGWTLERAFDISASGMEIVGNGIRPDGRQVAYRVVVPEPSTLLLMIVAIIVCCSCVAARSTECWEVPYACTLDRDPQH